MWSIFQISKSLNSVASRFIGSLAVLWDQEGIEEHFQLKLPKKGLSFWQKSSKLVNFYVVVFATRDHDIVLFFPLLHSHHAERFDYLCDHAFSFNMAVIIKTALLEVANFWSVLVVVYWGIFMDKFVIRSKLPARGERKTVVKENKKKQATIESLAVLSKTNSFSACCFKICYICNT